MSTPVIHIVFGEVPYKGAETYGAFTSKGAAVMHAREQARRNEYPDFRIETWRGATFIESVNIARGS